MKICPHCNIEFNFDKPQQFGAHVTHCNSNLKNKKHCDKCNQKISTPNFDRHYIKCGLTKKIKGQEIKIYMKEYREKNKEKISQYVEKNKEKISQRMKNYKQNNKEKIREQHREYTRNRANNDELFKLGRNLGTMLRNSFRRKGFSKSGKSREILDCSFEGLKLHLESKFEDWMSWENYGLYNGELNYGWDIDHIILINKAKTEEELIKLSHYTNLQPLCSRVNRDIKKGK